MQTLSSQIEYYAAPGSLQRLRFEARMQNKLRSNTIDEPLLDKYRRSSLSLILTGSPEDALAKKERKKTGMIVKE